MASPIIDIIESTTVVHRREIAIWSHGDGKVHVYSCAVWHPIADDWECGLPIAYADKVRYARLPPARQCREAIRRLTDAR